MNLVSVAKGGIVFRIQKAAPEVTWARQQGGYRWLWRQEVTDQTTGLHTEKKQEKQVQLVKNTGVRCVKYVPCSMNTVFR